jgi:acetolactate synthase regulatory subunit
MNETVPPRYVISVLLANEFAAAERLIATVRRRAPRVVDWSIHQEDPESVRLFLELEASEGAARLLALQIAKLVDVYEVQHGERRFRPS